MDGVVSECAVVEIRRKWEDLPSDCLANVFARVGMESLVLDVPFVCKSWSSINSPLCWQVLCFPPFEPSPLLIDSDNNADDSDTFETFGPFYDEFVEVYGIDRSRFSITRFIKLIVSRSKGMALRLDLPGFCTEEAYRYVADACPLVSSLSIPDDLLLFPHSPVISQVIGNWKYLMHLRLGGNIFKIAVPQTSSSINLSKPFMAALGGATMRLKSHNRLEEILVEVGKNCKYMRSLSINVVEVGEAEALAIVTWLPNLLGLRLNICKVPRDSLVAILQGCKKLGYIYVICCEGVEEDDEELWKLAKQIGIVRFLAGPAQYVCMNMHRNMIFYQQSLAEIQSEFDGLKVIAQLP